MKLLASISFFVVASLAAKYPAGTNCHSNLECNDNCLDGKWTITNVQGDYQLVCDPTKDDPTQYYAAYCERKRTTHSSGEITTEKGFNTEGKRSTQGDISQSWVNACNAEDSESDFITSVTASEAVSHGYGCDVNTVFPNSKRDMAFRA
ncbi:hypothetical protein N7533_011394 [Penicillium manginii]|uniref:uncharacterized protein n=1 Tax=Penicillium manginii TaxID=203109 RepID=UPI0025475ADC|nr:uncharacterized protein N7533_011394 [Penicillium manginii]KAJ5741985.1 hypothetical protein N7533_011394 [Penicillium manginii]